MNPALTKAWNFLHPDTVESLGRSGVQLAPTGGISLAGLDEAIEQAMLLLLSTLPGERVMQPDYGCPLNRLMFQPNDDTTAGIAIHYVRQALTRWEPRIEVLRVDAGAPADRRAEAAAILQIVVDYRILSSQKSRQLVLEYPLSGEENET